MKKALIFGVTGQMGRYLSELLLEKGYFVYGVKRRSSSFNTSRIDHLYDNKNFKLIYGDITDSLAVVHNIQETLPDKIFNLAAQSHVKVSFDVPEYTANVDGIGTLRVLEAVRILNLENKTRIFQASTSELYGKVQEIPQSETTPFYPRSPYACAKLYGYSIVKNYREAYNIFASNGIIFNTESRYRGETFITQKIAMGLNSIQKGKSNFLYLGNLNALRDWSHASDTVAGIYAILNHDTPDDFVLASGKQYSVRQFAEKCAPYFGMNIVWAGQGLDEVGIDTISNKIVIRVDPKYFRPTEVETLLGNPEKAKRILGWEQKISFDELVKDMCEGVKQ